eukprot:GDKI01002063.1.p1 GENE.GDKI01002063.1~~GDKI01002063.1.p1  ORF type:complete len:292 (-),score=91.61 GDKI01002063.1:320-1195(-)
MASDLPYTQLDANPNPETPELKDTNETWSFCMKIISSIWAVVCSGLLAYSYLAVSVIGMGITLGMQKMQGGSNWLMGTIPAFAYLFVYLMLKFKQQFHAIQMLSVGVISSVLAMANVCVCYGLGKLLTLDATGQTPLKWALFATVAAVLDVAALFFVSKRFTLSRTLKSPKALVFYGMLASVFTAVVQAVLQYYMGHTLLPYPSQQFASDMFGCVLYHIVWNTPLLLLIGWLLGRSAERERREVMEEGVVKGTKSVLMTLAVPLIIRIAANIIAALLSNPDMGVEKAAASM